MESAIKHQIFWSEQEGFTDCDDVKIDAIDIIRTNYQDDIEIVDCTDLEQAKSEVMTILDVFSEDIEPPARLSEAVKTLLDYGFEQITLHRRCGL